ncbi:MAG TPA: DUF3305 domain-containing protein [Burkholderiales bacterium]|nr:DUF3305 domain-containing protein [Burkholderiales bacterium]
MSASPSVRIAVVMERRPLDNPWTSESWLPVDVRADDGEAGTPRLLDETDGVAQWLFPGFVLVLSRDECEGYWQNLVSPGPRVFVMWRMEGDDGLPRPERVTASYDEASAWMDASESVEGVPMPEALVLWVGDYLKANFRPEPKRRIRPQSFKHPKDRVQS